tara:strand:- start:1054 stop:2241 length:1188 start_codon:yes stop_codon:yes gene_type:complete
MNRSKQKGMISVIILFAAGILALFSIGIINIGKLSIDINIEKQALDSCSVLIGNKVIQTNNIELACNSNFGNNCLEISGSKSGNLTCNDKGLDCNNQGVCKRKFLVSSTYNPNNRDVTKSVNVYVNEENHEVNIVDAGVVLLLDYSGSMRGNRILQLKSAVREFIDSRFNLSYSVILYNSNIIATSNIGKGFNHDQTALSIVNNNNPGGGTNFVTPLQEAIRQINSTNHEVYYILLISDGSPNEGLTPSKNFVDNNIMNINNDFCIFSTSQNPCISIFTLGVDNADINVLSNLSGNTLNQNNNDYLYTVNANQTSLAFSAIIEEIMCRVGPVFADDLYVFNDLEALEEDIDYVYDDDVKIIKFYDQEPFNICTEMLNNRSNITIRWGKTYLEVLE